jgi:hypothetical protein
MLIGFDEISPATAPPTPHGTASITVNAAATGCPISRVLCEKWDRFKSLIGHLN